MFPDQVFSRITQPIGIVRLLPTIYPQSFLPEAPEGTDNEEEKNAILRITKSASDKLTVINEINEIKANTEKKTGFSV